MPEEPRQDRPTGGLESVDRVIHEPARLAIMARLYVLEEADWLFLHRETGLSFGNLTSHLSRLEASGYVSIAKTFLNRKPHTVVRMTDEGRAAFEHYRGQMRGLLDS
jgi:DNA-binding MarR family transcriptional regulator